MKKNNILLYFLLIIPFLILPACSDDDNDKGGEKPQKPITVDPGSTLYGLIEDENENPIPGVVVSDGFQCVTTNDKGVYQMIKNENAEFVFYTAPAEYEINVSYINYPDFFGKIDQNEEKVRKDFTLKKLGAVEKDFTLICIGDPQCNAKDTRRFANETMRDIMRTVEKSSLPVYGLTLGDVVADEPTLFQTMRSIIASAEIPIFHTPGNHDKVANNGTGAPRDAKQYKAIFGPLNYSFNRGDVHFISMDNVLFTSGVADAYKAGFTDEQVEWLRQDLSYVSKDKMIIFFYHMPLRNGTSDNRGTVVNMLKEYKEVHMMVGHTHYNENHIHSDNMYEHIHGAACGAWWHSSINGDGTPVGYAVYDVKGSSIAKWYYKPSLYDESLQVRLHKGNDVTGGQFEEFKYDKSLYNNITITDNTVFANVWNADKNWKINLYEDGVDKGEMALLPTSVNDAWSIGYHIGVAGRGTPTGQGGTGGSRSSYLTACKHLYYKEPSNPNAKIKVVVTDRWGNKHEQETFTGGKDYETAIPHTY